MLRRALEMAFRSHRSGAIRCKRYTKKHVLRLCDQQNAFGGGGGSVYFFSSSYTVISTNVVGSKHEAKKQDRKLTWDFYELIHQNQSCLEKTIGCN